MTAEAIIRAVGLTRRFAGLTAVDHLNLEVAKGEIFGLVGPDGAGKTTTTRLLCGLMDPTEGEAWVAGHNVARETEAVKDQIGYMAQRFGLYGDLTVDENMNFYADLFGISNTERARMLPDLLRMTRMERFRERAAANLSGGMKQKLALICTLLHRPQVLFLDEPTNGVDPVSRRDFWAILYQLVRDGLTVFVTTAYLDEAERCNRVGLMNQGRMIQCASPTDLKRSLAEICYEVQAPDPRNAREFLAAQPGVLSVEPAGAALHLFLEPDAPVDRLRDAVHATEFRPIIPSLEDVFIGLVRKSEATVGRTPRSARVPPDPQVPHA
ncbi:MAG TPA: ABC transporter ATP-binding protein [Bryobacteraceae bacterium]|nr:ABC transporter ATP-binding protein [Bryobacteraceae bacterium]